MEDRNLIRIQHGAHMMLTRVPFPETSPIKSMMAVDNVQII